MITTKKVDTLIIGAGIIGTCLAYELQKAGRQVLVVDKGNPGYGCSYGNAGWLTPCFSMPLPQPGMFWKSIGWLLDPESPLYIKPSLSPTLYQWLIHFMKNMNHRKMNQSIDVLTEISKESLRFYSALALKNNSHLGFEQKGLIMVSATKDGLKAAEQEMELMARRGISGKKLSIDEILQLEPSLKNVIKGGVYFPDEAHTEPLLTVQSILKEFENLGGKIQALTEVYGFEFSDKKIKKVKTTKGDFEADLVIFALGSWSKSMAKMLQTKVPILGGKGYSLIVEDFKEKPRHPIMVIERKLAITPRRNSLRLAGTLELVDQDDSITKKRVDVILKSSKEFLNLPENFQIQEIWRGLRPCTPDGVPMIGFSKKWSNLFYSTGHQMLGLQSAPGSARLAREIIFAENTYVDSKPFAAERF